MSEATEMLVDENTGEVVAQAGEVVVEVVRNNIPLIFAVGVGTALVGGAVGYLVAAKKLTREFEERLDEEIKNAKAFYAESNRKQVMSPVDTLRERDPEAAAALASYSAKDEVRDEEWAERLEQKAREVAEGKQESSLKEKAEVAIEQVNVFVNDTFDLEEEKKHRRPDEPYILSHDEYFENEHDYIQSMLTYFEDDDVLMDEKSAPVDDPDGTVGLDHLVRFGSGSGDKNVVYVRNDILGIDFEITRSTGSYTEEVLGIQPDEPDSLKHSERAARRREFRRGNDG